MKDRIKFFSKYDMSIGFYLEALKKKLDEFDDTIEYNDINDISIIFFLNFIKVISFII